MFQRCWQSLEVDGVLPDMNAANRVIVVDIGSQNDFLKGGRLIYKANCSTGDYFVNFEKWIKERVLPNLPDDSVLVIDNVPYHGEQVDKVHSKRATKRVMIEWLQRHGESYNEKATRKAVLYEAVQRLKPPRKIYKIDNLLKENECEHTCLTLNVK
uniref:Tc1-like transposase DDE domain-containing protein n=1 Tax=Homalodisca liturata TaxID=320908 RepID=A0A1B6JXP9_9HEMI